MRQFELQVCLRSTENWIVADGVLAGVLNDRDAVRRLERGQYVDAIGPTGQEIRYRYVLSEVADVGCRSFERTLR